MDWTNTTATSQPVAFIKRLSNNPNLKIIVSSRPLPECVGGFTGAPKLRLQNLTRPDIHKFVHDQIGNHPYIQSILETNGNYVELILDEIIDRSSGVFLWVALACKSLRAELNAQLAFNAAYDRDGRLIDAILSAEAGRSTYDDLSEGRRMRGLDIERLKSLPNLIRNHTDEDERLPESITDAPAILPPALPTWDQGLTHFVLDPSLGSIYTNVFLADSN